jgi:hypothetical protein
VVSKEHLDRHHLAFVNYQPHENSGAKVLPIMRYGVPNHRPEPPWFCRQAEEDFEPEK